MISKSIFFETIVDVKKLIFLFEISLQNRIHNDIFYKVILLLPIPKTYSFRIFSRNTKL